MENFCNGKRPAHKPKMRFKDALRKSLELTNIQVDNWKNIAMNRANWRKLKKEGVDAFETDRRENSKLKKDASKFQNTTEVLTKPYVLQCELCSRCCFSLAGYKSHMRGHNNAIRNCEARFQLSSSALMCSIYKVLKGHLKMYTIPTWVKQYCISIE